MYSTGHTMIAREKQYNKLEKYSQMEQESWNRLNRSELWSGTDGADWTGTKYFSVDKDTNDIFINPKGVKALIDFYHEKAAN